MKSLKRLRITGALLLLTSTALGHEGHGVVGTMGHDLQHQLWTFAGLILLAVLVLGGEHFAALARRKPNGNAGDGR